MSIVISNNSLINNRVDRVGQIYHNNIFIYNVRSNRFINNTARWFSPEVFSYPYKFRLNLKKIDGKDWLAEGHYTLNNYPPNLQAIPIEFIFYDEIDQKINLAKYISSRNDFVNIVAIKKIQTVFDGRINNTIYKKS